MLRRVLCVCIGLCVFLSGAGVQPFISGADCRQGEYSDLTVQLLNSRTGCFFGLFFRTHWTFSHQSGTALCLPSRQHSHHWNYSRFISQLSENHFLQESLPASHLIFDYPLDLCTFKIASFLSTCFQKNFSAHSS